VVLALAAFIRGRVISYFLCHLVWFRWIADSPSLCPPLTHL
jgi:hypothetical protein